ncbi:MiaB/RimO family radical SAM methylthiotransferase [Candidatus Shapirobacteria bacterium]|nr:MiaB/RimO family radical SAM methylthiotransferase [Candidatus Shapirobacteria bacterium]
MSSPTFSIQNFGCRVNRAESKRIQEELINKGFTLFGAEDKIAPDLIILNTCAVTQKAEHETRQAINHLKREFPKSFLVVTGCAVETQKKLGINLPAADLFIDNLDKEKIPSIITSRFPFLARKKRIFSSRETPIREWVKIQDGCQQYCSFCLVPFLRPKLQSRPPQEIIKEINRLVNQGVQEVILCGINLSSFGQDLKTHDRLNDLINLILKKTRLTRLSLSSLTPNLITPALVETYLKDYHSEKRLSLYFHLALQTGSSRLHQLMNRPKTNLEKTKKLLQYIKQEVPEFNLRSDILVGFPGETEEDFQQTLQYIKETKIAFAHTFRFSARPGTTADKMIKNGLWEEVPQEIKKERSQKVRVLTEKIRQEEGKKLIGKKLNCLILGKKGKNWHGLTENFWETEIATSKKLEPKIIPIKITGLIGGKKLHGTPLIPDGS